MIKAIIFDMDGVLIDAKEWHYVALNKALAMFGYEISRYDHLVTFDGLPTRDKLQMLTHQEEFPVGLHSFVNALKQKYTMQLIHEKCAPFFPHKYALSRFKEEGFKLSLASNSIRDTVETMLQKAQLIGYMDFYLSNEDVNKGKPDPEIYLKAIASHSLRADQCLIIEDNPHGIAAARASGAFVMEVETISEVNYHNIMQFINNIGS